MRRLFFATLLVALLAASPALGKVPRYSPTGYFPVSEDELENENPVEHWDGVVIDEPSDLPKVLYQGNKSFWNPVTLSFWGLTEFDLYLASHKRTHLTRARRAGDWLVRNQDAHGAYAYGMTWTYGDMRNYKWPVPWTAAQAQGNAISLLVRLWRKTGVSSYRRAALRALEPFTRPLSRRGVRRRWRGHVFYEGFPTKKPSLCLEDFQFSLLALAELSPWSARARHLLHTGVATLAFAAPLYDLAGKPAYDLNHLTLKQPAYYSPDSHRLNQWLMRVLARETHNAVLAKYGHAWLASLTT